MTDDSKPKGPVLPGTSTPDRNGDNKAIIPKTDNKVISIKENAKDSKKLKEKKRAHQEERKKRKTKQTVEKIDSVEKASPQELQDDLRKKEREKYNDKKLKEVLRKIQQRVVKFATNVLPTRTASAGNTATRLPAHPLTSKMTGMDPNVAANTAENTHAKPQLQNQLQHQLQQQKSNTSTMTPKPRPPGG